MVSLTSTLRNLGGVANTRSLADAGISSSLTRAAARSGIVVPIRKGWVGLPDAPLKLVRAVELGGRLGCVSAAQHLGLWTISDDEILHVGVPGHSGRATAHRESGVAAHWTSDRWRDRANPVESLHTIVRQVAECQPSEYAIATLDSALNLGAISHHDLISSLRAQSGKIDDVLSRLDARSQSGLESLVRVRLSRSQLRVRSQVSISGVGSVDLIVGDRLVIETDGHRWHSNDEAFANDRRRDLALAMLGYRVLRLTYAQVVYDWARVELTIRELVSRREHLWPRSR